MSPILLTTRLRGLDWAVVIGRTEKGGRVTYTRTMPIEQCYVFCRRAP